jgi:hypothetical protein
VNCCFPFVPQIHVLDGGKTVHIYSRNAEDMTPRYPDILARLPSWLAPGTDSIVIDGEAVAWDPEKNKILPFQVGGVPGCKSLGGGCSCMHAPVRAVYSCMCMLLGW